jgi:hypothetical protein
MPKYRHNCLECKYHGPLTFEGVDYDIYSCNPPSSLATTMIARGGDEIWNYESLPIKVFKSFESELQHTIFAKILKEMLNAPTSSY